jgi:hypothetical protein
VPLEVDDSAPTRTTLGKVSLWTAVIGLVVPVALAVGVILVVLFVTRAWEGLIRLVLCGALLVILELVAFVCGIMARRTTSGKIGLAISGVLLMLALGFTLLFFWG